MHHQLWAEINLAALDHNLRQIRRHVGARVRILASVKANAYGHGMVAAARCFQAAGADMLGVARLEEGITLRREGVLDLPVLIFGYTPHSAAKDLLDYDLTASVFTLADTLALSSAAGQLGARARVHLKIDTGMGRLGLLPNCLRAVNQGGDLEEIEQIMALPGLDVQGIYTHFASADAADKSHARDQMACFADLLDRLSARGIGFSLRHAANSAAAMEMPECHLDMVRLGLALYGLFPFDETHRRNLMLKPAMTLKARIGLVKEVPAGFKVGYGSRHVTRHPTRIATVPVGYADGYSRSLSGRGRMLVAGCRAPVVGRVCMDLSMLEVGHIPEARVGSEVVILGSQGNETISADEIATLLGTISYEVVATVMARVPRVYVSS